MNYCFVDIPQHGEQMLAAPLLTCGRGLDSGLSSCRAVPMHAACKGLILAAAALQEHMAVLPQAKAHAGMAVQVGHTTGHFQKERSNSARQNPL